MPDLLIALGLDPFPIPAFEAGCIIVIIICIRIIDNDGLRVGRGISIILGGTGLTVGRDGLGTGFGLVGRRGLTVGKASICCPKGASDGEELGRLSGSALGGAAVLTLGDDVKRPGLLLGPDDGELVGELLPRVLLGDPLGKELGTVLRATLVLGPDDGELVGKLLK